MKVEYQRQLEEQRAASRQAAALGANYAKPQEVNLDGSPMLDVTGIYFKCPMIGPVVLPKKEMEVAIKDFLYSQLVEEPEMTTALIIHTVNKDSAKVKVCVETLCKYVDNIIDHPTEEKFWKIRVGNKAFQERVSALEGTSEFLQAAGFQLKAVPGPSGPEEMHYIMDAENAQNLPRLQSLKDVLMAAEPIRPELDRNVKVFHSTGRVDRIKVPDEFYNVTPDELKKEQQIRQEAVEKLGMLRTKEMRERERQRELRRYRYVLLRVRFPDNMILQGTFRAQEKLSSVQEFVRENIELQWLPFSLNTGTGQKLVEENSTLAELDLAPAAVLSFAFDPQVLAEVTAQQGSSQLKCYLNRDRMEEIMALQ